MTGRHQHHLRRQNYDITRMALLKRTLSHALGACLAACGARRSKLRRGWRAARSW